MTGQLDLKKLEAHRARTFNLPPARRVSSPAQAARFIEERGFIYFWPIKGVELPSLWTAVAGNRPVAEAHDDPGHITWGWKDDALDKRKWYYGKILRRKATMIALDFAPNFYALSANFGSPEEDYLLAYEAGKLTQAAKQIYETLLEGGALNTVELRRRAKLANAKQSEFGAALDQLQGDFKILPVGVAEAGAWKYAHIYDIVARHFPELPERARRIGESEARAALLMCYFDSLGAAQLRDAVRLFGWTAEVALRALRSSVDADKLVHCAHPKLAGDWIALPKLTRR